jgi:hypothetical protein
VEAILLLDNDGLRIVAKYYNNNLKNYQEQLQFEKKIHKTANHSSCIALTFKKYNTAIV